jgi:hypothetical protein
MPPIRNSLIVLGFACDIYNSQSSCSHGRPIANDIGMLRISTPFSNGHFPPNVGPVCLPSVAAEELLHGTEFTKFENEHD